MGDRLEELHQAQCRLAERLERLEGRVGALEAAPARRTAAAQAEDLLPPARALPQGSLALLGRTLLVLAGAYLVRALTDGHLLPPSLGVGLGIAYAAAWQLLADREALAGRIHSAAFHDLASSLIAFPLVWEATARFGLLPSGAAALALVAFYGLGLAVAWHRRLAANAVLTTGLAVATALALLVSTHDLLAALVALAAIACGVEWLAWRGAWLGLRWAAAIALDAVGLLTVAVVTRPELPEGYPPLSPGAAALALLVIPAVYVASIAARTLGGRRPVTAFEVLQGAAALLLGVGGSVVVLEAHSLAAAAPGLVALALGIACYAAAYALAERRLGQGRNFYLYSTAGGLLTAAGSSLVVPAWALPIAWTACGVAAAALGRRFGRMTLRVHGALYVAASVLQSGLLLSCARALGGGPATADTPLAWATGLAAAIVWLTLATDKAAPRSASARLPQLLLAVLVVLSAVKAAQIAIWGLLGGVLPQDAGVSAVVRTAVLAALALALAGVARRGELPELGWLVYPLLVLGGMKLLLQDLRDGRPATLVISLALYGLVLTLAPRLMKPRTTG
ncbi:MAG TPA: hypothetical protein VEQ10_08495 [Vicinamibacteria bacterium]|nr:hypothetical protein [Vicinamibacteria bacterium]